MRTFPVFDSGSQTPVIKNHKERRFRHQMIDSCETSHKAAAESIRARIPVRIPVSRFRLQKLWATTRLTEWPIRDESRAPPQMDPSPRRKEGKETLTRFRLRETSYLHSRPRELYLVEHFDELISVQLLLRVAYPLNQYHWFWIYYIIYIHSFSVFCFRKLIIVKVRPPRVILCGNIHWR